MFSFLLELLQVVIGTRKCLSRVLSFVEWDDLFVESQKQSVAGIAFEGVKKLPEEQRPPKMLIIKWIGLSEHIRLRNKVVDKQTSTIWNQLKRDGMDAVVLKGQGIATLYDVECKKEDGKCNLSEYRQSGDIDIWVKGGYQKVCDYVQRTCPTCDVAYHRFYYGYFKDVEVELHHRPAFMRNLPKNRKLTRWYNTSNASRSIFLPDKRFAVPSPEFNRLFILTHIYKHFVREGIGLRQIVDYYYVLKSDVGKKKEENIKQLKELGLMRFAEAMMWILHTQFGLEDRFLICSMNEKEGRFVLSEIGQTGNFGYGDSRYKYKHCFKLRRLIAHGNHLFLHYPSEILWIPIWLVYNKVWKWMKIREIRHKFAVDLENKIQLCG